MTAPNGYCTPLSQQLNVVGDVVVGALVVGTIVVCAFVVEYSRLSSLWKRPEKINKCSLYYPFLKLLPIKYIFSNNIHTCTCICSAYDNSCYDIEYDNFKENRMSIRILSLNRISTFSFTVTWDNSFIFVYKINIDQCCNKSFKKVSILSFGFSFFYT